MPAAAAAPAVATAAAASDSQCPTSVAIFQQSWSTYKKLLEADFLEHGVLYAALQALLTDELGAASRAAPLAMLDLGCGDASQVAASLRACGAPHADLRLASYTGVDVAAPALAVAAGSLAFLQPRCEVQLVEQDMVAFVDGCGEQRYDLAFSSFAVHHLSLEGKARFAAQVARCLKPGGLFVLVDVFRREGETRERYMERYRAHMGQAVSRGIVPQREADTVMEHVTGHDFPETESEWRRLAAGAGFAAADCLCADSQQIGRLLVLRTRGAAQAASAAAPPPAQCS